MKKGYDARLGAERLEAELAARGTPSYVKFLELWSVYPKRLGSNPKAPARLRFCRLIANGESADRIIEAARLYAIEEEKRKAADRRFIPMLVTWLNQKRWQEEAKRVLNVQIGEKMGSYVWNGSRWAEIDGDISRTGRQ